MMKEAEKLMKGYVREEDFFIVNYDLVLMTSNETITWMKENNYLYFWFLPMNGLQDGTPDDVRTVGNSPEFMPLNNSLNRATFHSLRFHFVLSRFLIDKEGTD